MKIISGDLQITKTKKGNYKLQALGPEYYANIPTVYESHSVKKLRSVKGYYRSLSSALNRAINLDPISLSDLDALMNQINTYLDGHGVEAIRDQNSWENYWFDTRAIYVNMGDTYIETILYDTHARKFRTMSWGDFVEKYDKKGTW